MTREILEYEQALGVFREAAARISDALEQLRLERAAIQSAVEAQRILIESVPPEVGRHLSALELLDIEDAHAAMAAGGRS